MAKPNASSVALRGSPLLAVALLLLLGCSLNQIPSDPGPLPTGPPFTLRQTNDRWRLYTPADLPFFSFGVSSVDPGILRHKYDIENPSYAAWIYYSTDRDWAQAAAKRLQSWGFSTAGAWSDFEELERLPLPSLYLTPTLQMGASSGLPWLDMWDEQNIRNMEAAALEQMLPLRNSPRLIGYYSDNELGWWNGTLWKMTLEQPASSGQRQRLIQLLRETYDNDWNRLRADFVVRSANNWAELNQKGALFLRPGGSGIAVMRRFLGILADRYYQLARDIIRKYDRRALYLGDRYQSFYYPEVAQAAAKYVDAISINLNAAWNDGTFPRFQLDSLHELTKRPMLISEIYLASAQNRSGNRNDRGLYPVAPTQSARAAAAQRTIEKLSRLPYVIGIDWFQYADEPTHGRYDGENFNFGLVDIHDRPYEELTAMFQSVAREAPWDAPVNLHPRATTIIPPAPADPFASFTPMRALEKWDKARGFVPCDSAAPVADLYLAWKGDGLYVGLYTLDIVEEAYYPGGFVPKEDRALLNVTIAGSKPIEARLGAGLEPLVNDPAVHVENLTGREVKTYTTAALAIPLSYFANKQLRAGDTIDLEATLATHARAYQMHWHGRFRLAGI